MGVGLHLGWAIEGAIGSYLKFDASYLSPHVNIAARVLQASQRYNVPIMMSQAFFSQLTGQTQEYCRLVDHVKLKGCRDPLRIYTYDLDTIHLQIEDPQQVTACTKKQRVQ